MDTTYISGFIQGVIAALIIGFVLRRMSKASSTMKQRNKPLDTFPDAAQPKLTPAGIVWKSTLAMLQWFFWLIILLVFIAAMLWSLRGVLMI